MNDTRIDAWVILFVTAFIFLMITCSGCSTTAYSNKDYIDRYVENVMGQNANKHKENRVQRSKDYNMYLKTRWTGK